MKTTVTDDSPYPYHVTFSSENIDSFSELLFATTFKSLWLSNAMLEQTRNLSILMRKYDPENDTPKEFGKRHYQALAELRTVMEPSRNP